MSASKESRENPRWVSQIQELNLDFYDATNELNGVQNVNLPQKNEFKHVNMDHLEYFDGDTLGTTGIYHCIGVAVPGEEGYLGHVTPGEIGKTSEELLDGETENVDSVTYVLGGSPNLGLFEEIRENFDGKERAIYTGRDGSIALDPYGEMYTVEERELSSSLV